MKKPPPKKQIKKRPASKLTKKSHHHETSGFEDIREELDEKLDNIVSKNVKGRVVEIAIETMSQEIFSGPIPHPKHIQAYEDACPGMADRIMTMAEKAQDAQLEIPKEMIMAEAGYRKLGLILGFATLLTLVMAATFCAYTDHPKVAIAFLGIGVIGTIGRFINGRQQKDDANNKPKDVTK